MKTDNNKILYLYLFIFAFILIILGLIINQVGNSKSMFLTGYNKYISEFSNLNENKTFEVTLSKGNDITIMFAKDEGYFLVFQYESEYYYHDLPKHLNRMIQNNFFDLRKNLKDSSFIISKENRLRKRSITFNDYTINTYSKGFNNIENMQVVYDDLVINVYDVNTVSYEITEKFGNFEVNMYKKRNDYLEDFGHVHVKSFNEFVNIIKNKLEFE